ncbi:MAG: Crp/Fnr family transcriptional regulator [Thermoflexales bacterium]|nr:Crp/Fnr family transcriptional regulator [Thermoflexales bacterium]
MAGLLLPTGLPELMQLMAPMAKALGLPDVWVRQMAEATRLCRIEAGQLFQIEGETVEALYVVLRGRIKVFCVSPQGREQVLHVAGPGDHINIVPIIDGGVGPASLQALDRSDLLVCTSAAFATLLEREPRLGLIMMRDLARKQRQLVRLVDVLALHSVQARVAQLLLARAEAGERGETLPSLTQSEMASQIGTVREMVARALKTLEGLGVIDVNAGNITVVDRAALEALREA